MNSALPTSTVRAIRTPRAAAVAGIVFSVLFATSVVLIEWAIPADSLDAGHVGRRRRPAHGRVAEPPAAAVRRHRLLVVHRRAARSHRAGRGPLLRHRLPRQRAAVHRDVLRVRCDGRRTGQHRRRGHRRRPPRQRVAVRSSQRSGPGQRVRAADGSRVHDVDDHAGDATAARAPVARRARLRHRPPCCCSVSASCRGSSCVFPGWVFVLSVHILRRRTFRSPRPDGGPGPVGGDGIEPRRAMSARGRSSSR